MGDGISSNENRKLSAAKWQGYVSATLENINGKIKETNENMKEGFKDIKKEIKEEKKEEKKEMKDMNNRINFLYFKVGGISVTGGLVVSLLINLIFKFFVK